MLDSVSRKRLDLLKRSTRSASVDPGEEWVLDLDLAS